MKHILISFLVLFLGSVKGQTYVAFPDSGAIWVNTHSILQGMPASCILQDVTNFCSSGEDTIINTETYFKVDTCSGGYKGALRDLNGKVYFVPKDSTNEYLLYDFDASENDTVQSVYYELYGNSNGYIEDITISFVDSVLIFGTYRKRLQDSFGSIEWIEGIGSAKGLFISGAGISNWCQDLACMSVNDTTLYPIVNLSGCNLSLEIGSIDRESYSLIYPNPASREIGFVSIEDNYFFQNYCLFDYSGKLIFEGQILNGKIPIPEYGGFFILQLENSERLLRQKLIVR